MNLSEIKKRINPSYVEILGTESYERKWLCDTIDSLTDILEQTRRENKAQLAELHAISEALGTSEGHSSVYWIEQLKQQCSDPALDFCHRFAVLMECMILSDKPHNCWDEANSLLEQYHLALEDWREANGEPYVSGFGKD